MTEESVSRALRKRERRVYEMLIEEHFRLLWTVASGILCPAGTREDVEEVIGDGFVALWEHPERFDPARGSLKNYLCLLARSRALDRLRALRRSWSEELAEMESGEDLETQFLEQEEAKALLRGLAELAEPERDILQLRFFYGLRPAEIACRMELPVNEVYERLRRGKRLLADKMREGDR